MPTTMMALLLPLVPVPITLSSMPLVGTELQPGLPPSLPTQFLLASDQTLGPHLLSMLQPTRPLARAALPT